MTDSENRSFVINPLEAADPEIARMLWALEDARDRTKQALDGLSSEALDFKISDEANTIGTLLYHMAAIEMDWLYADILGEDFSVEMAEALHKDVRDEHGRLVLVTGRELKHHLGLLDRTRATLLDTYRKMPLAEYRRERDLAAYTVTPEWVLHHLMQHEAEHRGEILTVRVAAERMLGVS